MNFTGMTSSTSQLCIDCCAQSVSLFFTVKILCSCRQTLYLFIYHSSPSCWRLWPSRRQIKAVPQPPISSDIYKICTEQASQGARLGVLASCCHGAHGLETFESFHDIATATWMTWWNQRSILIHLLPPTFFFFLSFCSSSSLLSTPLPFLPPFSLFNQSDRLSSHKAPPLPPSPSEN